MELHSPVLRIFDRLYRELLRLYSRAYRQRFSHEMTQVFRDLCRDIYAERGLAGLTLLWLSVSVDLLKTSFEERFRHKTPLTRERFIRLSGWGLMLGGVAWSLGFFVGTFEKNYYDPMGGAEALYEYGQMAGLLSATLLCCLGMAGLYLRYGQTVGRLGKTGLLAGAPFAIVAVWAGIGMVIPIPLGEWGVWMISTTLMFTGLALFGLVSWRKKAMVRWNGAPLLTGIWFPLFVVGGVLYELVTEHYLEVSDAITMSAFLIIAVGLIMMGHTLRGSGVTNIPEQGGARTG